MEVTATDNDAAQPVPETLLVAVEALVFAADEPVTSERLALVYAEVTGEAVPDDADILRAVDRLNRGYRAANQCFRIEAWAGGFRMASDAGVAPFLKAFFKQQRSRGLSRSLLETLAVIAYRQPTTKPEIEFVRGVDSDYAVRRLLELNLVDVTGRSDSIGRPLLYSTTPGFLEHFGLNNLGDLPNLREIEELLNDPAFNRERAQLLMQRGLALEDEADARNQAAQEAAQEAAQATPPLPAAATPQAAAGTARPRNDASENDDEDRL